MSTSQDDTSEPGTDIQPIHSTDIPDQYSPDKLHVTNVGGIHDTTIPIKPGINILSGENATNRTSLLSALNGVLGGTQPTIRTDSKQASIQLTFHNNATDNPDDRVTFSRRYRRQGRHSQSIQTQGDTPFCPHENLVDTFATLLENNPIRKSVENSDNTSLRDHLTSPIDTDHINRQITQLQNTRDDLKTQKQNLEQKIEDEPSLIRKRDNLEETLNNIEDDINELKQAIETHHADVEMAEEAEDLVEDLETKRSAANNLRNTIQTLESQLEDAQTEHQELENKHIELPTPTTHSQPTENNDGDDEADARELINQQEKEIEILKNRKNDLERITNDLNRVIRFNDKMLDNSDNIPGLEIDTAELTDDLNPDKKDMTCWTCGSTIPRNEITGQMNELRTIAGEHSDELDKVKDELRAARNILRKIEDSVEERKQIKIRLEELETKKETLEADIQEKNDELDELESEIKELQDEVEDTQDLRDTDLPETYEKLTQKEYKLGETQNEYENTLDKLDDLEEARHELEKVTTELENTRDELGELRGKVDEIETNVVKQFNEHMETVLDALEYDNIERVWIERTKPDSTGRGHTPDSEFDLHIVRDGESGVLEDRVENLSESERETIGLIAALTGYLVHDVHEQIPFMLLDSVEAVDSERLVRLVEYFAEHVTILFVALLPEDAFAFPDDYDRVTPDMF